MPRSSGLQTRAQALRSARTANNVNSSGAFHHSAHSFPSRVLHEYQLKAADHVTTVTRLWLDMSTAAAVRTIKPCRAFRAGKEYSLICRGFCFAPANNGTLLTTAAQSPAVAHGVFQRLYLSALSSGGRKRGTGLGESLRPNSTTSLTWRNASQRQPAWTMTEDRLVSWLAACKVALQTDEVSS